MRQLLGVPFEGDAYPETFLLADVKMEGPLDHVHIHLFLTGEGLVGVFPFRGDRWRIIVSIQEELEKQEAGDLQLDEIQTIVESRTKSGIRLTDPVWISRFHIAHRKIPEFRVGRIFFAGDSAHVHSPAGGQGMNTGIQDAMNLAWKLALVVHQKSPDSLLNSYNEEREPVAKMVLSVTDRLTRMATFAGRAGSTTQGCAHSDADRYSFGGRSNRGNHGRDRDSLPSEFQCVWQDRAQLTRRGSRAGL